MRGHAIILLLFWAFLSDVGIFYARQMKSYPKYARVHGTIFMTQAIFTYFFVFAMIFSRVKQIQELGY